MDDGDRLIGGRRRFLRALVLGTSSLAELPRRNDGCWTLALTGGSTLRAGILGSAPLRMGFRLYRTWVSGPVCSTAAASRCRLLRRADAAKEIRNELRGVLPQRAAMVAAFAGLGHEVIMGNRTMIKGAKVLFIAGFGPIARDIA